jgi:phosphohistidine swiveling domain-containing protein
MENMKYKPIFKLPYANIFHINLFLMGYGNLDPIVILKNNKFEMFLSDETLKKCAEEGFEKSQEDEFFREFEEESLEYANQLIRLKNKEISYINNIQFINFLKELKEISEKLLGRYKLTEFMFFSKIEEELGVFIKDRFSFEEVLSGKVDILSWPEREKKLASYMISMQVLKLKLRSIINDSWMGENSMLVKLFAQLNKRIKREDATSMNINEIIDLFDGRYIPDISERKIYSYITWNKIKRELLITSGSEGYRKIRDFDKQIPKNEVIGTAACKGYVRGIAKIIPLSINPSEYLSKMEKGDILVSDTTGPELMTAIEKAAAIVTDEGGLTSHAAVISREFGIPCVVGTSYATEVFKDGDLIEVNANNGVVRKI